MQSQSEEVKKLENLTATLNDFFSTQPSSIEALHITHDGKRIRVVITHGKTPFFNLMLLMGKDTRIILAENFNLQLIAYIILHSDFKDVVFHLPV